MNRTQLNNPVPPDAWFWSHDIRSQGLGDLMLPDMQLMRLSAYGDGASRRLAAVAYRQGSREPSSYILDRLPLDLQNELARAAGSPVSLTVEIVDEQPRFSAVLQRQEGLCPAAFFFGLTKSDLIRHVMDGRRQPRDLVTYQIRGVRWYAALFEVATSPVELMVEVDEDDLRRWLKRGDHVLTRLRGYGEPGARRFLAMARKMSVGAWHWYDNLAPDQVAERLAAHRAYPADLDAHRVGTDPVRFSVVMYAES